MNILDFLAKKTKRDKTELVIIIGVTGLLLLIVIGFIISNFSSDKNNYDIVSIQYGSSQTEYTPPQHSVETKMLYSDPENNKNENRNNDNNKNQQSQQSQQNNPNQQANANSNPNPNAPQNNMQNMQMQDMQSILPENLNDVPVELVNDTENAQIVENIPENIQKNIQNIANNENIENTNNNNQNNNSNKQNEELNLNEQKNDKNLLENNNTNTNTNTNSNNANNKQNENIVSNNTTNENTNPENINNKLVMANDATNNTSNISNINNINNVNATNNESLDNLANLDNSIYNKPENNNNNNVIDGDTLNVNSNKTNDVEQISQNISQQIQELNNASQKRKKQAQSNSIRNNPNIKYKNVVNLEHFLFATTGYEYYVSFSLRIVLNNPNYAQRFNNTNQNILQNSITKMLENKDIKVIRYEKPQLVEEMKTLINSFFHQPNLVKDIEFKDFLVQKNNK